MKRWFRWLLDKLVEPGYCSKHDLYEIDYYGVYECPACRYERRQRALPFRQQAMKEMYEGKEVTTHER